MRFNQMAAVLTWSIVSVDKVGKERKETKPKCKMSDSKIKESYEKIEGHDEEYLRMEEIEEHSDERMIEAKHEIKRYFRYLDYRCKLGGYS